MRRAHEDGETVNIRRALKELGFDTINSKFYDLIDVWKSWYDGDVKDFHSYTVWNLSLIHI